MKKTMLIAALAIITYVVSSCSPINEPRDTVNDIWRFAETPLLYGAEGSDTTLLVIQKGNLYGYGDAAGNIVIQPQFTDARPFCEGLAAVERDFKHGYIDKTGKTVIPFQYYGAADFHNGKALVSADTIPHEKKASPILSIIDAKGNLLEKLKYSYILGYADGMTEICPDYYGDKEHRYDRTYLDGNYQKVISIHNEVHPTDTWFSEGYTVSPSNHGKLSYIDKTGKLAFPGAFYVATAFSDGLAVVRPEYGDPLGYIDKSGRIAISPQYLYAFPFGEGLACVFMTTDECKIIDKSGNEVCTVQSKFNLPKSFSEGLCAVGRNKEKDESYQYLDELCNWGFIDTSGNIVIDFKFDMVTPFRNGIAQVLVDGRIGYINKSGKYIWEPK